MTETTPRPPIDSDDLQRVLRTYATRDAAVRVASETHEGWLDRIDQIIDVPEEKLATIHGQLIARGYLRFRLADRSIGLQYQLSPEGRMFLQPVSDAEDSPGAADEAIAA